MTIIEWADQVDWKRRVKAVCKPCWELKYCPYGILVEDFPLKAKSDDYSCRIYGHDCPVFSVSEPFTETREMRTISRSIPDSIKRRVLFRDKQVCQNCKDNIDDNEVHFDHVIPWSKGGSSDENNIQLLCEECNQSKSNSYERDNLIYSLTEHTRKFVPLDFILVFLDCFNEKFRVEAVEDRSLAIEDIQRLLEQKHINKGVQHAFVTVNEMVDFFNSEKPVEISLKLFNALKFRWGFGVKSTATISETSAIKKVRPIDLIKCENDLFRRLGMSIKLNTRNIRKWQTI